MEHRGIIAVIGAILIVILVILGIKYAGVGHWATTPMATTTPVASTTTTGADLSSIKSFEDCTKAGYPVAETEPRQCLLPDGRVYAEEGHEEPDYNNATRDMIYVTNPYAGAVTGKTFTVTGAARGTWYFEASFPVEVRDKNGKIIAQKPAQAQGNWMTQDFVPFSVEVTVPESYIGPATVILRKDNPSGLPQNDAALSIPITIEY